MENRPPKPLNSAQKQFAQVLIETMVRHNYNLSKDEALEAVEYAVSQTINK